MSKVDPVEAQELARAVLERQVGCAIRLANMNLESTAPQAVNMITDTTLSLGATIAETGVVCSSRYAVSATPESEEQSDNVDPGHCWTVRLEIHGFWELDSVEGLTAANAQAFALAVGAMALHPYARSQVQGIVTAAGYPPFSLDILNSLFEPEDDGKIDLERVDFVGS